MRARLSRIFSLPFFPIIAVPIGMYIFPLITGQTLFWGLPATQFIPWRAYAFEQMAQGIIPLWNPLNGMGAPLMANYQLALFYPPGWLVYLAGALAGVPGMAWTQTLLVPLHLAWAGVGMALLVRRLGFGPLAQAVSGLAFGMSSFFVARAEFYSMIWAGAWLPWILFEISLFSSPVRGQAVRRSWIFPGLIVAVSMQLLAGHAQLTWYTWVLAGLWVLVGGWNQGRWKGAARAMGILAIQVLIAGCITAIQLIPTAEYLLQSQRSIAVDFETGLTYSFWPWRLLTFLAARFFGSPEIGNYWGYASYWEDATYLGVLPLALGFSAVVWATRRGNQKPYQILVRFLCGICLVGAIFAFGKNTPIFPFLYRSVPTFSQFNAPARWMIWVVFGIALLAAVGIEEWKRPVGKGLRWFKRLTVAAVAVTLGAVGAWLLLRAVQITFIEAAALFGIWAVGTCWLTLIQPRNVEGNVYARWCWLVILLVSGDLVLAGWNSQPTISIEVFRQNQQAILPVMTGRAYLSAADEYALKFRRFFRFSDYQAIEDWNHLRQVALPNMNLFADTRFAYVSNFDPLTPGRYARWMTGVSAAGAAELENWLQLMDVSVRIQRDVTRPVGISYTPVEHIGRVRWLECGQWVEGEEASWQAVQDWVKGSMALAEVPLILEGKGTASKQLCDGNAQGTAKIVQERADWVQIEVGASKDGFLFFADIWYPGWKAVIDGKEIEILHANYAFRGVAIGAGKHRVEFLYSPQGFYIGAGISAAAIVFMLLWGLLTKDRVK